MRERNPVFINAKFIRWLTYVFILMLIIVFSQTSEHIEFIYFQF